METHTFVFCGDPQMGKTPLAQSVLAWYARARGRPHFIKTSTADSLRTLSVQGFFVEYMGVLLDEWRVGAESQDKCAALCDFIKCLTDVDNPGATRMRYSDVKFAHYMPRVITCNGTRESWHEMISTFQLADSEAILKRLVFVEFDECVIPERLRNANTARKRKDLASAMDEVYDFRATRARTGSLLDHVDDAVFTAAPDEGR